MKTMHKKTDWKKLMGSLTVASALAVTPLLGGLETATAAPKNPIPSWGWRDGQAVTVDGDVTERTTGDNFRMRLADGSVIFVDGNRYLRNVRIGDRVEVSGTWRKKVLTADSVRLINNTNNGVNSGFREGQTGTWGGVVTQNPAGDNFRMRLDGTNREVYVDTARDPKNLRVGDHVAVAGTFQNGILKARSAYIGNDEQNYLSRYEGQAIDWTGVVTDDKRSDNFWMRLDNGREVFVDTLRDPRQLSNGDRVRVVGSWRNGIVHADSATITRNVGGTNIGNGGNGFREGQSGTWFGRVTQNLAGNNFRMRLDNGRDVEVVATSEPRRLSVGDQVEASGYFQNGILRARSVYLVTDVNNRVSRTEGQAIDWTGTVIENPAGDNFWMRLDNGREVFVDTKRDPKNLSVGDRVRVVGTWGEGIVKADTATITRNVGPGGTVGGGTGFDERVLTGVVTEVKPGDNFRMRLNGGREVFVDTAKNVARLSVNDTVEVHGAWSTNREVFKADTVRITNDRGPGAGGGVLTGADVSFPGTVQRVDRLANTLRIRGDNGTIYVVRYTKADDFTAGDKVRVVGHANNAGIITATSVTRR